MMGKLQTAIEVFKRLANRKVVNRHVTGNLPIESYAKDVKKLHELELLQSQKDQTRAVEFVLPNEQNSFFAIDLDDLLEAGTRQIRFPAEFYLANLDFRYPADMARVPLEVVRYLNACKFASQLVGLADMAQEKGNPRAIFLHNSKLVLSLSYKVSDLVDLPEIDKFIAEFIDAEIHKEQKRTIIKSVLFEMLKSNEIDKLTLPCLMRRFVDFTDRVSANYQLYVSEFSFEKIREQVEKEKFEFTAKLNKTFSDIQNQLLAVPVALVLVGSQIEMSRDITAKNVSIWLGSIVFAVFMSLLIRNQYSTLAAIKAELDSQWVSIKDKHILVAGRLHEHYDQLRDRYNLQRFFLSVVSLIVSISIIGSTAMFLYSSGQASQFGAVLKNGSYAGIGYIAIDRLWVTSRTYRKMLLDWISNHRRIFFEKR